MGEFDIDRIVDLLDSGEFLWTDLCWCQGMAGWAPLANLRSEVAAAKAFPPVAAMPAPVASGRRPRQPAAGAPVAAPKAAAGSAGWWWVVAGISLGALIGLLTTHFFPTVVQVDRPVDRVVEKIVDRPVEVVRTVEKEARLTTDQQNALAFVNRIVEGKDTKLGITLFKLSDKVKVISRLGGDGASNPALSVVPARVEAIFRRYGFRVLSADSKDYPFTIVYVGGVILENTDSRTGRLTSLCGFHSVALAQPVVYFSTYDEVGSSGMPIKKANITLYEKRGSFIYGSSNLTQLPDLYVESAELAAAELRKTQDN
jgi:hypothetical protein